MNLKLLGMSVLGAVLLAGCGSGPRTEAPAPVDAPQQPALEVRPYRPPETTAPAKARPVPNRAVRVLLRRAQDQLRDGKLAGAAASLERALRIAPRDAHIWYRLAEVRERQGRFGLAEDLANKSNALAGSDQPALRRDNWRLIARARRAVGDLAGARAAQRRAAEQRARLP